MYYQLTKDCEGLPGVGTEVSETSERVRELLVERFTQEVGPDFPRNHLRNSFGILHLRVHKSNCASFDCGKPVLSITDPVIGCLLSASAV
jgi:hypothetical protein